MSIQIKDLKAGEFFRHYGIAPTWEILSFSEDGKKAVCITDGDHNHKYEKGTEHLVEKQEEKEEGYHITVREVLQRTIHIKAGYAEDAEDALLQVERMYSEEEVVLSESDFTGEEIYDKEKKQKELLDKAYEIATGSILVEPLNYTAFQVLDIAILTSDAFGDWEEQAVVKHITDLAEDILSTFT